VDLTCGLAEKIQFAMAAKNLAGELRARHADAGDRRQPLVTLHQPREP
jgi:hypothetical protein